MADKTVQIALYHRKNLPYHVLAIYTNISVDR